jgi:plastocyanin
VGAGPLRGPAPVRDHERNELRSKAAAAALTLAALTVAPVAISHAGSAAKPKAKTVKIGDNFFAPDHLKVAKNTKIVWKWPANAGDVHDVKLKKGPKGVKKFHSEYASSEYSFARTLKQPGRYTVICTIHQEMKMTIRVKS